MSQHTDCFFPSWTVATCLFKQSFRPKLILQMSHLNGLFPSWTVTTCLFKWTFNPNLVLQISQLNCLLPLWIVVTCLFNRVLGAMNFCSHARTSHLRILPRTHFARTCAFCLIAHRTRTLYVFQNIM